MGLEDEAINMIKSSLRMSSFHQYSSYLRRFFNYCSDKELNLESLTYVHLINFLHCLYDAGLGYSALNTARSAVSTLMEMLGRDKLGQHSLVCRYLKGIFQMRPSLPRYISTWDPNCVVNHLRSLGDDLDLLTLSMKCVTLLLLCTSQRQATIHSITLTDLNFGCNKIKIKLSALSKQSRQGYHLQECVLDSFHDKKVCPVTCLSQYLEKTKQCQFGDTNPNLFITSVPPYKTASKSTLARWVRIVLKNSGVDSKYKPHSIRSATSSDLFCKGVPIDDIVKKIGWSSESTFARFYKRQVESGQSLSSVVLSDKK